MTEDTLQPELPKVMLRGEAKALGLSFYYTGVACKNGHIAKRQTRNGACHECRSEIQARAREKNPQAFQDRMNRWRCKNKDYEREYRAKVQKKINARQRRWRASNNQKMRIYQKRYYDKNREKMVHLQHVRRARILKIEGFHTKNDVLLILSKQKHKCAICKCKLDGKHEVDHIIAVAKGGSNWPSNLQMLCRPCNRRKSARDPIDHMQSLGFLL